MINYWSKTFLMGISLIVMVLSSCSRLKSDKSTEKLQNFSITKDIEKIISTRPETQNSYMIIVKFKNPSLLENSSKVEGVTQIDEKAKSDLESEQKQAEEDLKKISENIKILFRYKYVLNAFCVLVPKEFVPKLSSIGSVASTEEVGFFRMPISVSQVNEQTILKNSDALILNSETVSVSNKVNLLNSKENNLKDKNLNSKKVQEFGLQNITAQNLVERNSVKFIGADLYHEKGYTGKGVKVGVIDTGIDYTHSMFNGVGTAEAYKAIDPSKEAIGFPSEKIVGGIDLVGTSYDAASPDFSHRIPRPDLNPLDEGGHGTHVAGTIAGLGDFKKSYNGVAPDAQLYAIKVFGAEGSTSDMVVMAALEYAVDPNGDGDLRDQLDVVNLSLGSGYGNPKILYAEAVRNLVKGGTVAVISAGNSGDEDYIVGSPGTSTEALSVAASIDNTDHNWNFGASEIQLGDSTVVVEAISAILTTPISETQVDEQMVYVGLAAKDFTDEEKAKINGKVALIDRGVETFNNKIKRAVEAGAVGVVVANNVDGEPFAMGTSENYKIPAIMVSKDMGAKIKLALQENKIAKIKFNSNSHIQKPELIDTITSFSSKGPRSIDGFIKPEIAAPGSDIISAAMGKGSEPVKMSGTSMAAPHMTGAMALMIQKNKEAQLGLTALELKNLAMGTAKPLSHKDDNGNQVSYPISRQGSGRIQLEKVFESSVVADTPSISLGEMNVESKKTVKFSFKLRNFSDKDLNIQTQFSGSSYVTIKDNPTQSLKTHADVTINLYITLDATQMSNESVREMDGLLKIVSNGQEIYHLPLLAIAHKISVVKAESLIVDSSAKDSDGALSTLKIKNDSLSVGKVESFNLLAFDDRKPLATLSSNADCDLQAVGYRLVNKVVDNQNKLFLQFGFKTFKPMTTWNTCDFSVLVDSNKDQNYEQEILGSVQNTIPGFSGGDFSTHLIDFAKAREIRKAYEAKIAAAQNNPEELSKLKGEENYEAAILDEQGFQVYNNSTIVISEVDTKLLSVDSQNQIHFKIVVSHNDENSVQADDYLKSQENYLSISLNEKDQGFLGLESDGLVLNSKEEKTVELTKGQGLEKLLLLMPQNKFSTSDVLNDDQLQVVEPVYRY